MSVSIASRPLGDLAERHGGEILRGAFGIVRHLAPIDRAASGDLAPFTNSRYLDEAVKAVARGAMLLVDDQLSNREDVSGLPGWFHPYATYALAEILDTADVVTKEPVIGSGCKIGIGALILPGVVIGDRVTIGPGSVIGAQGFGFAIGPEGASRAIPHHAGVVIEDDVHIGPLSTIAAGTLAPTRIGRGCKLDAQSHIGHNCDIGEGTIMAAQCGLAGSVTVGRRVMMGGQVGIADHIHVGDDAKIAAKSGVIGDIPAEATFAGYPAVARGRWLRGLAELYRLASRRTSSPPSSNRILSSAPPSAPPPAINPAAVIKRSDIVIR